MSLESGKRLPLLTLRVRIGKSRDCEVRPRSDACDQRQCYLEFDGKHWNLNQESRSFPTYVDGEVQPYARLKSGSRITFSDGGGYQLVFNASAKSKQRRRRLWVRGAIVMALIAAGTAVWLYFRSTGG